MERFCDKCGTLVSGDGEFCPSCGARLEGAVSVPSSGGIDLNKPAGVEPMMPNEPLGYGSTPTPTPTPTPNTYQGQSSPNYNQQPVYPQAYNQYQAQPEMSVGSWVLTIFLSGLGIIGIILLFVWGFSDSTPTAKKNYARAMLIWQAIAIGLVIIFYIGMFGCVAALGGSMSDIWDTDYGYYAMLFR